MIIKLFINILDNHESYMICRGKKHTLFIFKTNKPAIIQQFKIKYMRQVNKVIFFPCNCKKKINLNKLCYCRVKY